MWVFYTNRGQGISSFGTRNKDSAILEFFPANKAYQTTSLLGFRTFVKAGNKVYEPFSHPRPDAKHKIHQSLEVSSHELVLNEQNNEQGLSFSVLYFTVPGEPIAALARQLTITNTSKHALELDVLDGLPVIQPYGMNEFLVKQMSRTIEAWMMVENLEKHAPYFRLKVDPADRPELVEIHEGNFYFNTASAETVVDPEKVFGSVTDFSFPLGFSQPHFSKEIASQITSNKTPCAFTYSKVKLQPGQSKIIRSFCGHADSVEMLNRYVKKAKESAYFDNKRSENKAVVDGLKSRTFSVTSFDVFDQYCGQTFLDNVLRGGFPFLLGDRKDPLVHYAYSRKHGDPERDYNRFLVEPSYFSEGDGNYRDVNQNRRNDNWFNPKVGSANIRTFLSLIQLDGYNPLVIKGVKYHFKKGAEAVKILNRWLGLPLAKKAENQFKDGFSMGSFYRFLVDEKKVNESSFAKLLGELKPYLDREQSAEHGEGFWVDHWTYNLDLIESYLAIYPEKLKTLLLEDKSFTFYDNDHIVEPRASKYVLKTPSQLRQYKSVLSDSQKKLALSTRLKDKNTVHTQYGKGDVYRTTLLVKLLCLFANKFSSLDAFGVGIEMESDKPGWLDALNGLPGLLGSSLCESFELKRLSLLILQWLDESGMDLNTEIVMMAELADWIEKLDYLCTQFFKNSKNASTLVFWDEASSLKESFRAMTRCGVSGKEKKVKLSHIKLFLEHAREKLEIGLEKSFDEKKKLYPTYYENEVTRFSKIKNRNQGILKPTTFHQKAMPLFLEGIVHALKVEKNPARRRMLVKAVKESELFDKKLKMYKLNAPLGEASIEIGRAKVFAPGWLENESVWLHMEYKYLLEILRSGLVEEFYQEFKNVLIPFQDPARYGRSILENSSFIVSSAFNDAKLHGAGFVARLSGSTAEFLHMWLLMNVGRRPFSLGPDGKLALRFEPALSHDLFTKDEVTKRYTDLDGVEQTVKIPKNALAFLFLGKTLVVYHNPRKLDTFGNSRVSVKRIVVKLSPSKSVEFKGDTVPSPYSLKVRDEFVPRIDVELG